MFKQILEPICEERFHPNSFGFRPNKSAHNAIALNNILVNKGRLFFTIDLDIKGFFDNINHNKLIKQLWKIGINDKTVLSIIKRMLKTTIVHQNSSEELVTKGTPQGGILSPLLANICLNELDWWLHNQWSGIKTRHNYTLLENKCRALKKSSNLREVKFVRYADDFKVYCRTRKDAEIYYKLIKTFIEKRLRLEISTEKSKIINLKRKKSAFLGFEFKAFKRVNNKYYCLSYVSKKAKNKITEKLKKQICVIQRSAGRERIKHVIKYNSIILGIHNYYRIASNCSNDFSEISFVINKSIFNRLRSTFNNYKDDRYKHFFKGYNYKVWSYHRVTLFTIQTCTYQKPLLASKNTPKILKRDIFKTDSNHKFEKVSLSKNPEWELIRATTHFNQKGKCYITNKYLNKIFDVHHIIPKEYGGTDDYENLVMLDPYIHKELHKNKPEKYLLENQKFLRLWNKIQKFKNKKLII